MSSTLTEPTSLKPLAQEARRTAAFDLLFALLVFLLASLAEPFLDQRLRQGSGLAGVSALALYQFTLEGLAVLFVLIARREHLADYGFVHRRSIASVATGILFAALYDLAKSWNTGDIMWIPFRRHSGIRISLAAGIPVSIIGIALTLVVWGFFEAFFGVFFARKVNQVFGNNPCRWLSPGALGFAVFNGLIHFSIGQGFQGFAFSFASGYAIAVIPSSSGNAWGSVVVQTLTNAVGKW